MTSLGLLAWATALLLVGAMASLAAARWRRLAGWIATVFVGASTVLAWLAAARALTAAPGPGVELLRIPALGATFSVALDALSAVFLAIVTAVGALATLYSVDYMNHYREDGVGKFYPVLLVFFASIIGVLVVRDLVFFLVFWELMTLSSFFLVVYERNSRTSQRAGLKYFVITHAATLCLVGGALIVWRQSGSFGFQGLREAAVALMNGRPVLGHLMVALFVLGFATKAGILPMGDWLPDAHPVAPTGVSAVLSGALVKLGIYGLMRVMFECLPAAGAARVWGVVIAVAGTVSLFVGTLTALKQSDSKRLMAFHTIGQIGYVCLGLGVGFAFVGSEPAVAVIGLAGGLLHAVNHACFKGCLFLGAGAVLYRTGERDMNRLGGLGSAMPMTAGATTVASLAIAGVPPLNGFTSKWLIVASCIIAGFRAPVFLLLGLIAMFVSLATLASFLKLLAAVFLGPPRGAGEVREVPATMVAAQWALASSCIALGVFPALALRPVQVAVAPALGSASDAMVALASGPWALTLAPAGVGVGFWSPVALIAAMALLAGLARSLERMGAARRRDVPVWTCGEEGPVDERRYPSSSYYVPFKHAFDGIYPVFRLGHVPFPAALRRAFDIDSWLYSPVAGAVDRGARQFARTHLGIPQVYLLWIVAGAVLLAALLLGLVS